MDLVIEDDVGVYVLDHKFVSTIPQDSVRFMDAQTALYQYAGEQLGMNLWGYIPTI